MNALTYYRPRVGVSALENAFGGIDRYLNSFFGDTFLTPSDRIFNRFEARFPPVDVRETEKAFILEVELPGFDEKDIEIRLDNNTLIIESKKEDEKNKEAVSKVASDEVVSKEASGRSYLIRERRVSSFSRSFKLPENADSGEIGASFKNGILSLEIGKKAEAQKRVIQISKK